MNIYCDGSCSIKTKIGCYGIYVEETGEFKTGTDVGTTNQRMELMAFTLALMSAPLNKVDNLNIFTDSAYIFNCLHDKWYVKWIVNGWRTSSHTPVVNKDLWEKLFNEYGDCFERFSGHLVINKIKGHEDCAPHNLIDQEVVSRRKLKEQELGLV